MKNLRMIFVLLFIPVNILAQTYSVGDFAKGGIVFSVDESSKHGLVCVKFDQMQFGDWHEAVEKCKSLTIFEGGKTYKKWRLPTKEEIDLMFQNRKVIDSIAIAYGGSAFDKELGSYYWSSTEEAGTGAWLYSFGFGYPTLMSKESNSFGARAVRSF